MVPCDQRKQRGGCCAARCVHGVLPDGVTKVALQGRQRVVHCSKASNPNTASKVSPSSQKLQTREILNPLKSYEANPPAISCHISLAQLGSSPPRHYPRALAADVIWKPCSLEPVKMWVRNGSEWLQEH